MDNVFKRDYKHANIEVVVEDDIITTARIFVDEHCQQVTDITTDKGEDVPFNKANLEATYELMKADVDVMWEECYRVATANR